ncbi:hypothetical protein CWI38_0487p0040 [Hamiltosporidium tvaerminnensis]|uniref:Uncharacterized protein n=1 Tax=Hamiltosporidium tvaerminnensis TaxID=1176355 RepID=A0A4Q9LXZ3_9MICR|nr:hypothetical protein CWI38_0487p0040 [Hamiltosporidium tvaerminnensis]
MVKYSLGEMVTRDNIEKKKGVLSVSYSSELLNNGKIGLRDEAVLFYIQDRNMFWLGKDYTRPEEILDNENLKPRWPIEPIPPLEQMSNDKERNDNKNICREARFRKIKYGSQTVEENI